MIKKLIILADLLDSKGHIKEADIVDSLIKNSNLHVAVKELPATLQSALKSVGFHAKDIKLQAADRVSIQDMGSEGRKGFAAIVNLDTGEFKMIEGSWGGANMFNQNNPVDLDRREHEIPFNSAIIKGSTGYGGTYATIYVRPDAMAPLLPTTQTGLSEKHKKILAVFKQLISSARKEYLQRLKATPQDIEELIAGGYLQKNKAGSISITTSGKNNAASSYYDF